MSSLFYRQNRDLITALSGVIGSFVAWEFLGVVGIALGFLLAAIVTDALTTR
jgi:hypothetical protein